jgi:hypothetical protein
MHTFPLQMATGGKWLHYKNRLVLGTSKGPGAEHNKGYCGSHSKFLVINTFSCAQHMSIKVKLNITILEAGGGGGGGVWQHMAWVGWQQRGIFWELPG